MKNSKPNKSPNAEQPVGRFSGFSMDRTQEILNDHLKLHAFALSQMATICSILKRDFDAKTARKLTSRAGIDWEFFQEMVRFSEDEDHPYHELAADWELSPTALGRARVRVITPEEACMQSQ
jgi:hypothetical protein